MKPKFELIPIKRHRVAKMDFDGLNYEQQKSSEFNFGSDVVMDRLVYRPIDLIRDLIVTARGMKLYMQVYGRKTTVTLTMPKDVM